MTLSDRISALLTNLDARIILGNEAEKAYAEATGGTYTPYDASSANAVLNNGPVPKAVANASLTVAGFREETDEPSEAGREQALRDIAAGRLKKAEVLALRLQANTGWDARSMSRGVERLKTNENHVDFTLLKTKVKELDTQVAAAVATKMLEMLGL